MISLQPQEQYTIVRQLGDHTDTSTYYVQAVVRDSVTDAILKTLNLTDKGSRRFKINYEIPADVSGLGFYIDITTTVYSDDTYTTKAVNYSEENESYLVFDRIIKRGGGGGGADIDYKKIAKIVADLLKEAIVPPEAPEKVDFEPLLVKIGQVEEAVRAIVIPENEKADYTVILKSITAVKDSIITAIDNKEVTESPDLSPVLDKIDSKDESITQIQSALKTLSDAIQAYFDTENEKEAGTQEDSKKTLLEIASILSPMVNKVANDRTTAVTPKKDYKKIAGSLL